MSLMVANRVARTAPGEGRRDGGFSEEEREFLECDEEVETNAVEGVP